MRWVAAFFAFTLAAVPCGRALAAAAEDPGQALFGAAFADAALSNRPGFVSLGARYVPGQGLVGWSSTEVSFVPPQGAGYVDSLRITSAGYDARPGAGLLRGAAAFSRQAYAVTYVRNWPSAVSVDAGGAYSLDITPHAGLGVSSGGGRSAEAGALVRFGSGLRDRVMRAVGMNDPPRQRPRLYLFAGAAARTMERNLAVGEGAVRRSQTPEDGYVQETRAGVGVGRGSVQALFGYTRELTRLRALGEESRDDHRVGLTLSIR